MRKFSDTSHRNLTDEDETDVIVSYCYEPGYRGTYYDPPEPATVEINVVRRKDNGVVVELSDDDLQALAERILDDLESDWAAQQDQSEDF